MKDFLFCIFFTISTFSFAQHKELKWWQYYVSQNMNIDIKKKELWYQKELKKKKRSPSLDIKRNKKFKNSNIKEHLNSSKSFRTDTIIFEKFKKKAKQYL